jgi:hypothetical protein
VTHNVGDPGFVAWANQTDADIAARQPLDADLTAIAALDSATAGALVTDGSGWIRKTYAQLKTALGLVKADVGLGNVDNTADTAKPVSTAQQTALNLKADLASPALTGTPTAPTAAQGTNTTQVATTAFARAEIAALVNSAPGTLDTLGEIATALQADESTAAALATTVGTKAATTYVDTQDALRELPLLPTAVKTTNYSAAAQDFVPVDTTSGAVTVTLPTAPADKTQVGVKHITQGGTNAVTVACGGSDVLNKAGGSTSFTMPLLAQAAILQYKASTGIWYILEDDLPLGQLDLRYPLLSLVDAKGDLLVGSADNTVVRKAVGSDGQVLTADTASAGGVKWATASGAAGFIPGTVPPALLTGTKYMALPANVGTGLTNGTLADGTAHIYPMIVPVACTLNSVSISINTAGSAGAVVRFGLYDSAGARVADLGTVVATAVAIVTLSVSQALSAGNYYVAGVVQGAAATPPGLRMINSTGGLLPILAEATLSNAIHANSLKTPGYAMTGVTGAMPANLSGLTALVPGANLMVFAVGIA